MYINVDNGGTFTDFWAYDKGSEFRVKTRTTPHDLSECLFEGLRLLAEEVYRNPDVMQLLSSVQHIRYSTTQGTNALVQRKGPNIGLVLPDYVDIDEMKNDPEAREMFDTLVGDRVAFLSPEEINMIIDPDSSDASEKVMQVVNELTSNGANRIVVSLGVRETEHGFHYHAVRRFPEHLLGTVPILITSDVTADKNWSRATWTASLNAFLHPAMEKFLFNTDNRLREMNFRAPLLIFRNDGMAGRVAKTSAVKTYGSGPEGGVCGAEALAKTYQLSHLVTLDVGGTTTDFGIVENEEVIKHRYGKLETVEVSIPMSDLRSIGVGGGSIIKADNGQIKVGPESVGAAPGPACFGFGGTEATITDIKLLKGVIDPAEYFGGRMSLDKSRALRAVNENVATSLDMDEETAIDAMEDAWVSAIADQLKNYIKPETVLGAFGGAGPFSICAIAEAVNVNKVMVPAMAAVFSASGISQSDIGHSYDLTLIGPVSESDSGNQLSKLLDRAEKDMFAEGYALDSCEIEWFITDENDHAVKSDMKKITAQCNGLQSEQVLELRLTIRKLSEHHDSQLSADATAAAANTGVRLTRFAAGEEKEVPVYLVKNLTPGMKGEGPAIIEEDYFTLPVTKGWSFNVTRLGDIELTRS